MAVTRLGIGAGGTSTGAAVTFNSFNIVTSNANTVAIVGVAISVSTNSTSTTCAVTYGGTAMTQLGLTLLGSSTSRSAVGLYYLFNPGTGTKSVVVTPGGTSTKAQVRCQSVAFSGVDTSGVGTAQTASATTHAPTSVANGYDIRVLVNGAALSSPNQTQEYLGGASVGGVGDYMAMQSAAGTGSTISFTCTGTATTPGSIATALTPVVFPAAATLVDNFSTQDTAKWTFSGTATVANGQLQITPDATYSGAAPKSYYDLTGSFVGVKIVQLPNIGNGSTTMYLRVGVAAGDFVEMAWGNGTLYFTDYVNNVSNGSNVSYDPVAHKYWRIRESGGTVYWDTSADGIDWTNRRSNVVGIDLSACAPTLFSGFSGTEPSPGTAIFDSLNVPVTASLVDDFSTQDTAKWTFGSGSSATNGQCAITNASANITVSSNNVFDLTDSSVTVQAVSTPNTTDGSSGMDMGFYVSNAVDTGDYAAILWQSYSGVNSLRFREGVDYSHTNVDITYDAVAHKFWRIRHSSSTNLVYWDTSSDGVTWTNQRSKTPGAIDLTNVKIVFQRYFWQGTDPGGTATFDNVNIPGVAAVNTGQFFAMF